MATTRDKTEVNVGEHDSKKRPNIFDHLPPLSAPQPAYSERPKIVEYGAYTKASPTKEKQYYRHASDSVANNYTPSAQSLSTKIIYKHKVNRSAPPTRRNLTTSKRKQEYVVEENVKVLHKGRQSVPGTYSMLSESTPGNMSKSPAGTFNMGFVTKGRYRSNQASPAWAMRSKSEADPSETKEIGLDSSILSHNKPPRLKRVQSAGHAESQTPATFSDVRDSGFHGLDDPLSESSPNSKRTRVAWGSTQGTTKSIFEETPVEMDSTHKTPERHTNGFHGDTSNMANNGREYDEETVSVLNIVFPPASTPTLGLPRAVAPPTRLKNRCACARILESKKTKWRTIKTCFEAVFNGRKAKDKSFSQRCAFVT